jgi:hypothetical protein
LRCQFPLLIQPVRSVCALVRAAAGGPPLDNAVIEEPSSGVLDAVTPDRFSTSPMDYRQTDPYIGGRAHDNKPFGAPVSGIAAVGIAQRADISS